MHAFVAIARRLHKLRNQSDRLCDPRLLQCAVHTTSELRMTGNCLHGSRHVLYFDPKFDTSPHYKIMKELFTQVRSRAWSSDDGRVCQPRVAGS